MSQSNGPPVKQGLSVCDEDHEIGAAGETNRSQDGSTWYTNPSLDDGDVWLLWNEPVRICQNSDHNNYGRGI